MPIALQNFLGPTHLNMQEECLYWNSLFHLDSSPVVLQFLNERSNLLQIWGEWGCLMPGNKKNLWVREAIKKEKKKQPPFPWLVLYLTATSSFYSPIRQAACWHSPDSVFLHEKAAFLIKHTRLLFHSDKPAVIYSIIHSPQNWISYLFS